MSLGLASLVVVLIVASAAWVPPRTVTAPTVMSRHKTEDEIQLKERVVGSHDYLFIANYCSEQQKKLVGEYVKVCDTVGAYPPSVSAGAGRFSPLRVDCPPQNEPCSEIIYVNITLYCEPAPTDTNHCGNTPFRSDGEPKDWNHLN